MKLARASKNIKQLELVVSSRTNDKINHDSYVSVMTQIFGALGEVMSLSYPDCYQDILSEQFDIAKRASVPKSSGVEIVKTLVKN